MRWYPQAHFKLERRLTKAGLPWPDKEASLGQDRVLFVVQGATQSDLGTLLPVIRGLQTNAICRPLVVTADAGATARLGREGIEFHNLYGYRGDLGHYSKVAREVLGALRATVANGAKNGFPGFPIEMRRLGVFEALAWRALLLMHTLDAADELLDRSVRAVVVASDVHPVGKAIVHLANARGIPTIVVQHGLYGNDGEALTLGFLPLSAATVCVWGEGSAQILERHGVARERIRLTGQPRFDQIVALREQDWHHRICDQLELAHSCRFLTFASQNIFRRDEQRLAILQSFGRLCEDIPESVVVVKLHPAENLRLWEQSAAKLELPRVRIVKQIDLHRLLAASDVVMTVFSTVGLEALLLGKPLVVLTDLERSYEMEYLQAGAAIPAESEHLTDAVRRILYDSSTREALRKAAESFVRYHTLGLNAQAADRVSAVIYDHQVHAKDAKE